MPFDSPILHQGINPKDNYGIVFNHEKPYMLLVGFHHICDGI